MRKGVITALPHHFLHNCPPWGVGDDSEAPPSVPRPRGLCGCAEPDLVNGQWSIEGKQPIYGTDMATVGAAAG